MTNLRRERVKKFEEIIVTWIADSPAIIDVTGDDDMLEYEIARLAALLSDASISQSEHKTDETPGEYKPDLVDAIITYQLKPQSIRQAVNEYFRLNIKNWETRPARQFLEWAHSDSITPEQIQQAANIWRCDKRFNWQAPTLNNICEKWLMLMDAVSQPQVTAKQHGTITTIQALQQYIQTGD